MNAIDGKEEVDSVGVYGGTDTILCAHPECKEIFSFSQKYPSKKYHAKECKNAHHKMERVAGQKVLARGTIHAGLLENSGDRLIPIAKILSSGNEYTPMEIDNILREQGIYCYHITTALQELKKNGLEISKRHIKKQTYAYRLTGGQSQLLRIAQ
ncbi:hypothetical protein KAR91_49440 [Candidatus Pacearchaeota archaeon]|nr:hypothetical protein [Candidatus Pacearchaeota archaeon]